MPGTEVIKVKPCSPEGEISVLRIFAAYKYVSQPAVKELTIQTRVGAELLSLKEPEVVDTAAARTSTQPK